MDRFSSGIAARCRVSLLLLTLTSRAAFRQATDGAIDGLVRDPSGALIHKAQVQVTNVDTGVIRETQTNETGQYVVSNLPPGS